MVTKWKIVYTKQALKDAKKIADSGLKRKVVCLLKLLEINPFQTPPPYEKLVGDLTGAYSLRLSIQHRLVHQIFECGLITNNQAA